MSIELFEKIFYSFIRFSMRSFTPKSFNNTFLYATTSEHLCISPLEFQQIQGGKRSERKVAMSRQVVGDSSFQSGAIGWNS